MIRAVLICAFAWFSGLTSGASAQTFQPSDMERTERLATEALMQHDIAGLQLHAGALEQMADAGITKDGWTRTAQYGLLAELFSQAGYSAATARLYAKAAVAAKEDGQWTEPQGLHVRYELGNALMFVKKPAEALQIALELLTDLETSDTATDQARLEASQLAEIARREVTGNVQAQQPAENRLASRALPLLPKGTQLAAMEEKAERLLAEGQIDAYETALQEMYIYLRDAPGAERYPAANVLVKIAGFLVDYRGDLQSAHTVLTHAINILATDLGPFHPDTLHARAEWIYIKNVEIDTEQSWRMAGRVPRFWDGTATGKTPSDEELDVFRRLAIVQRDNGTQAEAVTALMNYVSLMIRAGLHNDAVSILKQTQDQRLRARNSGHPQNPEIDFVVLQTLGNAFISNGQYDQAAAVYSDGADTVVAMLRAAQWAAATYGGDTSHLAGELYGQHYAMAAWHAAQGLPAAQQEPYKAMAFEAMQLASYGPAAAAVSRATLRNKAQDPVLAGLVRQWQNASLRASASDVTDLTGVLKTRFPEFLASQMPVPMSVTDVQKTLIRPDEALITFLPAAGQSGKENAFNGLVVAVTRDNVVFSEVKQDWTQLVFDIMRLHNVLDPGGAGTFSPSRAPLANVQNGSAPELPLSSAGFEFGAAERLYTAFFGDPEVAALIAAKPTWTLVPLGETLSIPFPALIIEDTGDRLKNARGASDLRALRWLGHEKALNIVPSVTALASLRQRRGNDPDRLATSYVGFGDPAFSGRGTQNLPPADAILRRGATERAAAVQSLPRLPGTRREVETLTQVFDATNSLTFLGVNATEAQVRTLNETGALQNIGVLHFATHGLLGGAFDGLAEPALALSPQPGALQADNDGLLTASEAARLTIDADWVILSACDTAGQEGLSGDGLGGLVQGFFSAGARNMLVSHWRVDDVAAERLITDTVIRSQQYGTDKAEALRLAMKGLAADTSRDTTRLSNAHPSVWAPFLLVGGG